MQKRSIFEILVLCFITLGIYWIIWLYKTKEEMRAQGAEIPTIILFFVPFWNVWWFWKYGCGVELVTKKAMGAPYAFLLTLFLGFFGTIFIQAKFNEIAVVS